MPALYLLTFLSAMGWALALTAGPPSFGSLEVVGGEITQLEPVVEEKKGRNYRFVMDSPRNGGTYLLHRRWVDVYAALEVGQVVTVRVIPDTDPGPRTVFELAEDGEVLVPYEESVGLYYVNAAPAAGWMTVVLFVCSIVARSVFGGRRSRRAPGW